MSTQQIQMQEQPSRTPPLFTPMSSSLSARKHCPICYQNYDNALHQPLLVCPNRHSVCKDCLIAIKRSQKCPFCREGIDLARIKHNSTAANYVKYRQQAPQQRLNTDQSQPPHQSSTPSSFINPHQFFTRSELLAYQQPRSFSFWDMLVYILLIVLQLPFGLVSMVLGFQQPQSTCMDHNVTGSNGDLRSAFISVGYFSLMLGMLSFYFLIVYKCVRILPRDGHNCFLLMLSFISCFVSLLGSFLYGRMFSSGKIMACGDLVQAVCLADLIGCGMSLVLGVGLVTWRMNEIFTQF